MQVIQANVLTSAMRVLPGQGSALQEVVILHQREDTQGRCVRRLKAGTQEEAARTGSAKARHISRRPPCDGGPRPGARPPVPSHGPPSGGPQVPPPPARSRTEALALLHRGWVRLGGRQCWAMPACTPEAWLLNPCCRIVTVLQGIIQRHLKPYGSKEMVMEIFWRITSRSVSHLEGIHPVLKATFQTF